MKFEVADTAGLEGSELTGLIGHSIVPGRYSIDEEGFIHVDGKSIDARVEWNHNEYCHHIRSMDLVRLFLGNGIDKYSVASEFEHPKFNSSNKKPRNERKHFTDMYNYGF